MRQSIPYDALLALHLLAVAAFLAGLVLLVALLPGLARAPMTEAKADGIRRLRQIDRLMTTPALVTVWLCGIGMSLQAGWYVMDWLRLKVACVAVLTAIHANRAWRLHALARGAGGKPAGYRLLWLILVLVVTIGTLVIAKPF